MLSVSPASGTVLGGTLVTIFGSGFESSFNNLCRWGGWTTHVTYLNGTHLECPAPSTRIGRVPLEVTLNGQQYTANGAAFFFYSHPVVRRLTVAGHIGHQGSYISQKITLPEAGYIMVRAFGSGYMGGTDYRCRINWHAGNTTDAAGSIRLDDVTAQAVEARVVPATYDTAHDAIQCWSNMWLDGINTIEVTLNGRQYTPPDSNLTINVWW